MRPGWLAADGGHLAVTAIVYVASAAVGQCEAHHEDQKQEDERNMRQVRNVHGLASNCRVITSATPIRAFEGRVSSTPRASRFPFNQVPFMLWSTIRKRPWAASRRNRKCSRETSSLVYRARFTCVSSPPR